MGGAGETISISGNLHELDTVTIEANGGVHLDSLFQPQGVSGTGLTTGDKYQGVGETRFNLNIAGAGLPFTTTFVNNFDMIGQGPGNNFKVHENFHITVNPTAR